VNVWYWIGWQVWNHFSWLSIIRRGRERFGRHWVWHWAMFCVFVRKRGNPYHPMWYSKWTSDTESVDKLHHFSWLSIIRAVENDLEGIECDNWAIILRILWFHACFYEEKAYIYHPISSSNWTLILILLTSWHHFSWLASFAHVENDLEGLECDNWAIICVFCDFMRVLWGKGYPLPSHVVL